MSLNSSSGMHPALQIGDFLPQSQGSEDATHLFVSLSELILESVFYHPSYRGVDTQLDTVEIESINAILGELDVDSHFVATLCEQIISAIKPQHSVIRIALSGAGSDSFGSLLGGKVEPQELNPALGLRGVSRYASETFNHQFALECRVIQQLREQGHQVEIVVPFVRALSDAAKIIDLLAEQGLPRGLNGLKVHYMVDVPAAALLAERLLHYFDGLVINLENLAQYTLGVDRLSEELEYLFDPESDAIIQLVDQAVQAAQSVEKPVLLSTSGLSQYPRWQEYFVEHQGLEIVVTA